MYYCMLPRGFPRPNFRQIFCENLVTMTMTMKPCDHYIMWTSNVIILELTSSSSPDADIKKLQQMTLRAGRSLVRLMFVVCGSVSVLYQFWTSVSIARNSIISDDEMGMAPDVALMPRAAHLDMKNTTSGVNTEAETLRNRHLFSDADDNMLCPTIPTDHGTWSRTKQNFTWTRRGQGRQLEADQIDNDTTTTPAVLFVETMTFPNQIAVPWKTIPNHHKNDTDNDNQQHQRTVVFYGSSHLRELYFSFVRLARGLHYSNMADLGQAVTTVGSGFPDTDGNRSLCDPERTGYIQGAYGVDLVNCGTPTIRLVPELVEENNRSRSNTSSVAIGFKTFLHTPDADTRFLKVMDSYGLRHPDVLLVDVGIWGLRGDKGGGVGSADTNTTLTPEQELEYYLSWISDNFASSRVVWIYEPLQHDPHLSQLILSRLEQFITTSTSKSNRVNQQHVLFRKDWLMRNKPKRMPCRHGCGGPLVGIMAMLIRDWMLRPVSECFE